MLAGEDGPGGIQFDDFRAAYLVGSLALAAILFQGGLSTERDMVRQALWPSVALATAGVAISAGVVGMAVVLLFGIPWPEALLLGAATAPFPVQWLADNGSAYTARETLDFAAALSLVPCFTPVRSPESNGVSEAFVKTLKRDYARVQPRPDALTVLAQLPGWIDDYNENHPHRGLRMRSPREFIRSKSQPAPCPV